MKKQSGKRIIFFILFVLISSVFLTEMVLKIPAVKSIKMRSWLSQFELPSSDGYELSASDEAKIKEILDSIKAKPLESNLHASPWMVKDEPMSPLAYIKGKGSDLGISPIRSIKADESSGKTIYDVNYRFDSQRRRLIPTVVDEKKSNGTIAIVGCSMVFGIGVNDAETIPAYVQSEVGGNYKVLNLGFMAGGANDFLDEVSGGARIKDLDEKKGGVAVYVYFPVHRESTLCLSDCYREEWRRKLYLNKSAWEISDDFEVTRKGTVGESRSVVENFLREIIYNSEVGRLSKLFYSANNAHYQAEYTKYIKALSKQWEKRNFKFVVFLLDTPETPWDDNSLQILKENSVDFIYFKRSSLFSDLGKYGVIPGDEHFNSAGNRFTALQIVEGLKRKGLITLQPSAGF